MSLETAERAVRDGDLDLALNTLQDQIRKAPEKADLRVFLFQLLCVQGQWARALNQLDVAAELDAATIPMAQMYRETIRCEQLRADVFAGRRSPLVFGEPEPWLAWLIEALAASGTDRKAQADDLRGRAFEAAPASPGSVDGQPFEWIADADMRLGPVCEAMINGRYYWVPFNRLSQITIEAPTDLRDLVWTPVQFTFANGGETVGAIPTRYPGSENADDPQLQLARKTAWIEDSPEMFTGLGQRVIATDSGEHPLMDVRAIDLAAATEGPGEPGA
jgi:type VI secretion system protein ImpE